MLAVELLPERRCDRCTDRQKGQWGCEADAPIPIEIDGEEEWRCPRRPILERTIFWNEVFWLYGAYKAGFLPQAGGLKDQPALLLAYFRGMDYAYAECEEERQRRNKKKAAKGKVRRK